MTRKNFKYPWHKLDKEGDFFITRAAIDKISKAAAMHFALRRPNETVRCLSRPHAHDVMVVLVEASANRTSKYYEGAEYVGEDKAFAAQRVVDEVVPDLDDVEVEDFEEEELGHEAV
jgi:hypothetical protein